MAYRPFAPPRGLIVVTQVAEAVVTAAVVDVAVTRPQAVARVAAKTPPPVVTSPLPRDVVAVEVAAVVAPFPGRERPSPGRVNAPTAPTGYVGVVVAAVRPEDIPPPPATPVAARPPPVTRPTEVG